MELVTWVLGLLGAAILALLAWILKQLVSQGALLTVLVSRVGTLNPEVIERRLGDLESDQARMWGIYDAWKGPKAPNATDRLQERYS
jgi:hypothetical protein